MSPERLAPIVSTICIVAVFLVWIRQQRQIGARHALECRRRGLAARAVLPGALMDICKYSEECARVLRSYLDRTDEDRDGFASLGPSAPAVPADVVKIIRGCIENAEEDDIPRLAECIRRLQVQHARLQSLLDRQPVAAERLNSRLVDAILLHAYTSRLFPYALTAKRYDSDRTYVQYVSASAHACGIFEYQYPEIFKILGRLSAW